MTTRPGGCDEATWQKLDDIGVAGIIAKWMQQPKAQHDSSSKERIRLDVMRAAGVPERHIVHMNEPRPSKIVDFTLAWWKNQKSWCCLLADKTGTGKSFAAACVVGEWARQWDDAVCIPKLWYPATELHALEREQMEVAKRARLVVLDEVGGEYESQKRFSEAKMYELLASRYDNMRKTIITSNLIGKDFADRFTDERLLRRLRGENGDVLHWRTK